MVRGERKVVQVPGKSFPQYIYMYEPPALSRRREAAHDDFERFSAGSLPAVPYERLGNEAFGGRGL